MGYTHYYNRPKNLLAEPFKAFAADVQKLVDSLKPAGHLDVRLDDLTIDDKVVCFNGEPPFDHETFMIERDYVPQEWETPGRCGPGYFDFCKTAHKPYDLMVTSALVAFKHHFGSRVKVSSDGNPEDWAAALTYCEAVLGYKELPFAVCTETAAVDTYTITVAEALAINPQYHDCDTLSEVITDLAERHIGCRDVEGEIIVSSDVVDGVPILRATFHAATGTPARIDQDIANLGAAGEDE